MIFVHRSLRCIAGVLCALFIFAACTSREPGWLRNSAPSPSAGDFQPLLRKVELQTASADTKEKVESLIQTYERILKYDPLHVEALLNLGRYYFLIGYGYEKDKMKKEAAYLKAAEYAECVMYRHPQFRQSINSGMPVWEACDSLSSEYMGALVTWYLAMGSRWIECFNGATKLFTLHHASRFEKIRQALMTIDPDWAGGTPFYIWANYYATAPTFFGGDMKKAAKFYETAIRKGPGMLNFRRTRALFFHTKNADKAAFQKDLNWVVSQDTHKTRHYLNYPWNVFIQRNARELLSNVDQYFKNP